VVEYLKKSISFYTLYHGAPELKLDISNEGIRMVSTSEGITGMSPANDNKVTNNNPYSDWLLRMERQGAYYLAMAKEYLDRNVAQFADYDGSEAEDKGTPNYGASASITGTDSSIMT